jgi:FixJ family two-component response regulator
MTWSEAGPQHNTSFTKDHVATGVDSPSSLKTVAEPADTAMIDLRQIVFIVSGDAEARRHLRHLLAENGLHASELANAPGYIARSEVDAPGCLLLDLTLPDSRELLLRVVRAALDLHKRTRERRDRANEIRRYYERLTAREREVFALVVSGLMNKQVASKLGISEVTVEIHRGRVMRKMAAASFAELVRMSEVLLRW